MQLSVKGEKYLSIYCKAQTGYCVCVLGSGILLVKNGVVCLKTEDDGAFGTVFCFVLFFFDSQKR